MMSLSSPPGGIPVEYYFDLAELTTFCTSTSWQKSIHKILKDNKKKETTPDTYPSNPPCSTCLAQ
jgi:hypothetical protein